MPFLQHCRKLLLVLSYAPFWVTFVTSFGRTSTCSSLVTSVTACLNDAREPRLLAEDDDGPYLPTPDRGLSSRSGDSERSPILVTDADDEEEGEEEENEEQEVEAEAEREQRWA